MELLTQISDSKIAAIYASRFLEHVVDVPSFVRELVRGCVPGANIEIIVPHFSNARYYSDLTHRTPFGLYSFCYLAESDVPFRRKVPKYVVTPGLRLTGVKLGFRPIPDWPVRHILRRAAQLVFNRGTICRGFTRRTCRA